MSGAEWSAVVKRVVQRVEVSKDTMLFVPTVGKAAEWERKSVPRGRAKRRANLTSS